MPQFGILLILVPLPLSGGSTPRESMPVLVRNIMLLAPWEESDGGLRKEDVMSDFPSTTVQDANTLPAPIPPRLGAERRFPTLPRIGKGLATALLFALPLSAYAAQDRSVGVWRNPQNSVHVRAEPCGGGMCGVVVWANDKAKADARRGGTDPLVGTQLFRDFRKNNSGTWRGRVFVPDMNRTFSGTITILDENRIRGRGCLVGGVGCRSQIWTRITR